MSVKGTKVQDSRNPLKPGRFGLIEFTFLESSNPGHEVGSSSSQYINMANPKAHGNWKAFIFAAALDLDPSQVKPYAVTPEPHDTATGLIKAAVSVEHAKAIGLDPGFLIGREVRLETVVVKTKAGTDFTVYNWTPFKATGAVAA